MNIQIIIELIILQVDEELLKKQQAAYSVAGVDEEVSHGLNIIILEH